MQRSFTTDESGLYVVPAGRYSVTAKSPGLQTTTVNDLILEFSRVVEEDFRLAVAAATESVEIVVPAPVINTATTAVGTTVDQRAVQEIPLNGRHFVDLGLITAGTIAPPAQMQHYPPTSSSPSCRIEGMPASHPSPTAPTEANTEFPPQSQAGAGIRLTERRRWTRPRKP